MDHVEKMNAQTNAQTSAQKCRIHSTARFLRVAAALLALTAFISSVPAIRAQQPPTQSEPPKQAPPPQAPSQQAPPPSTPMPPAPPPQTAPTPKPIPAGPAAKGETPDADMPPLTSHTVPGINNFGQVTPRLYRGAQPSNKGYDLLQKMGVDIVVNFRNEDDQVAEERRAVETRNMKYFSIPWSATDDPSSLQVREFFETLRANPDKRVFVHCQKGADRTGTMIAIYRIATEKWQVTDAVKEMHDYHYHAFWFPHLARYVQGFPQQLQLDPTLVGAVPAPAKPPTP